MDWLVFAILLGLIPAAIARSKGKGNGAEFVTWWLYGALLFIIALPHAIMMQPDKFGMEDRERALGKKKCPHCAEMIQADAKVCRYCQREV